MHSAVLLMVATLLCPAWVFADGPTESESLRELPPVMVSLNDREAPSADEWESLHDETERAGLFGSLGDLKSTTISFMNTRYFTANCGEGTLAAYGKMAGKSGFDRYGHIDGVQFDVPRNSWKERYALNASALVKLAGKARFAEFAGVDADTAANDRRQIEVTFVGTIVPKDEAIRRLNADIAALEYLGTLQEKALESKKSSGLFGGRAVAAPKVVLANVMMLDGKSSRLWEGAAGAGAASIVHGVGGQLRLSRQTGEDVTLLTPVVRCYRTYSIEFQMDGERLQRVKKTDAEGQTHHVPVIFDLTPDL